MLNVFMKRRGEEEIENEKEIEQERDSETETEIERDGVEVEGDQMGGQRGGRGQWERGESIP